MKNEKIKLVVFIVCALLCTSSIKAQIFPKNAPTTSVSWNARGNNKFAGNWLFSYGLNIVEDGGTTFLSGLEDKSSLNFSNPFIFGAEYYTSTHFSINTSLSFNKYLEGKLVDTGIIQKGSEAAYFAFDVAAKYSFKEMYKAKVFDPYLVAGAGYTNIGKHTSLFVTGLTKVPAIGRMTINYGFGANLWVFDSWGVNLNIMAKHGIERKKYKKEITNQIQISFGGVYRIPNS